MSDDTADNRPETYETVLHATGDELPDCLEAIEVRIVVTANGGVHIKGITTITNQVF